jgi:diaminohydroxyphosphoribosylaminopyrimidine deaminase/5-amino-6-(5-phosphoribosylamino)uracil reductase
MPEQNDKHLPDTSRWMERALALARAGIGHASPNPTVGCVLVRDGQIVGEGFHRYANLDHAEIVALREAGGAAKGATAYVTLEPCNHTGRTGPCTAALIAAGVRRVVAATEDPTPQMRGTGIAALRAAGIEVEVGEGHAAARSLNDAFAKFVQVRQPFVTAKIASSLDGRIAPAAGSAVGRLRITNDEAQARVQLMRHNADAVMTGIGTVLADDPRMNDRSGLPRRRPLVRVVLDTHARTPPDSQLVAEGGDSVIVVAVEPDEARARALESRGVSVRTVAPRDGRVDIAAALALLSEMQITSVLLEAGARVNASAFAHGLVDKAVIHYAPLLLGGDALPMLSGDQAFGKLRLEGCEARALGDNVEISAYLRDWWAH